LQYSLIVVFLRQTTETAGTNSNKKFELMLTRCAKAYSSLGSVV